MAPEVILAMDEGMYDGKVCVCVCVCVSVCVPDGLCCAVLRYNPLPQLHLWCVEECLSRQKYVLIGSLWPGCYGNLMPVVGLCEIKV